MERTKGEKRLLLYVVVHPNDSSTVKEKMFEFVQLEGERKKVVALLCTIIFKTKPYQCSSIIKGSSTINPYEPKGGILLLLHCTKGNKRVMIRKSNIFFTFWRKLLSFSSGLAPISALLSELGEFLPPMMTSEAG